MIPFLQCTYIYQCAERTILIGIVSAHGGLIFIADFALEGAEGTGSLLIVKPRIPQYPLNP